MYRIFWSDWMTTTEAEIIKILAEERNMRKAKRTAIYYTTSVISTIAID